MAKRHYKGTIQAQVSELTRQRLFDVTLALYQEKPFDAITLNEIAERAGVTVQTILRHFRSKEGLLSAVGTSFAEKVTQQRGEAPVGNIAEALNNLIDHYEMVGLISLRSLSLEGRFLQIDEFVKSGRDFHRAWVERVFAPFIARSKEGERGRIIAQLVTLCDVYIWKLLRLDGVLTREQTEVAMYEMVIALFEKKNLLSERET